MKSKLVLVLLMLMTLAMFGCSSNETNYVENNPDSSSGSSSSGLSVLVRVPVLFGVVNGPFTEQQVKKTGGTSLLNVINTKDGSAVSIGDIGYRVNSIAYDFITNKLYGITSDMNNTISGNYKNGIPATGSHSQLIDICPITGHGTPITEITVDLDMVKTMLESIPGMSPILSVRETGFGSITFNSFGTLVAWTYITYETPWDYQNLAFFSTIDLITGVATPFSFFYGGCYEGGIAFDNLNVLYLINRYYDPDVNTIDMSSGEVSFPRLGVIDDTAYRQEYGNQHLSIGYYHGDFHPITGKHWSIDLNSSYTDVARRNLFVVDIKNLTIEDKIPTIDNLEAITFGFVDVNTLNLLGLTDLIDSLIPKDPE